MCRGIYPRYKITAYQLCSCSNLHTGWLQNYCFIYSKIKRTLTGLTGAPSVVILQQLAQYFGFLPFCIEHLVRILDVHTHTILPHCVYWFCWLPTNNFWSIASLSRLMLCGWLMSATINGLMLPMFEEPRTNPSIWVTVGIHWQAEACLYWHTFVFWLSFPPSFYLSGSLIQSHSPALFLYKAPSFLWLPLSLYRNLAGLDL